MNQESPLETALDLFVYVPVGFAVAVAEEVPKLAAKGRSRIGGQMAAARLVGQLAVAQGRKMMSGASSAPPRPPAPPRPTAPPRPPASARTSASPQPSASPRPQPSASPRPQPSASPRPQPSASPRPQPSASPRPQPSGSPRARPAGEATPSTRVPPTPAGTAGPRPRPRRPPRGAAAPTHPGPGPGPSVSSLAIPGYDSLSASQVVQRLDGLSGDELEAVRRYEAAGRGRRTILARVSQLQGA